MKLKTAFIIFLLFFGVLFHTGSGIQCYMCFMSNPSCGLDPNGMSHCPFGVMKCCYGLGLRGCGDCGTRKCSFNGCNGVGAPP